MNALKPLILVIALIAPSAFADLHKVGANESDASANLVVEMLHIRLMSNCVQQLDRAGNPYVSSVAECRLEIVKQLEADNGTHQYKQYLVFLKAFANSHGIALSA